MNIMCRLFGHNYSITSIFGNYGICEVYQKDAEKCECPDSPLIAKERLMEVPNATKGVFCKEKKKLNLL